MRAWVVFERIGYLEHGSSEGADKRTLLGNERDLPAWNCDEATGGHTFYIV